MTCELCGLELVVGSWPFCKGGHVIAQPPAVIGDEIDEINENVAHEPVHFRSRAEKRRYLKEHNLQEFVRHVGTNEGDRSPNTTRWI